MFSCFKNINKGLSDMLLLVQIEIIMSFNSIENQRNQWYQILGYNWLISSFGGTLIWNDI